MSSVIVHEAKKSSNLRMAAGSHTTVAASDEIATGLKKVLYAVANFESAPVDGAQVAKAVVGDQAGTPASGSILIESWKATATADTAVVVGTTFTKLVSWIAVGY
jgi:hypothetical protein